MRDSIKNPHPFDMSLYYSGEMYSIGGKDFEVEEEKNSDLDDHLSERKPVKELDWSFLKAFMKQAPDIK